VSSNGQFQSKRVLECKAMRPLICQYVGFLEAGIRPLPNGCAKAMLTLKSGILGLLDLVKALGRRLGNVVLLTAARGSSMANSEQELCNCML
jgi:hypothetical protein